MEEKSIVAYQGKTFQVTLQSMLGSTNYGWCLASLPEGIVLSGTQNVPTSQGIGPVNQIFYFGVVDVSENPNVVLVFKLLCLSDYTNSVDEVEVNVQLVPYNKENMNSNSFVQYSENSAVYNAQMPYGFVLNSPEVKYGYPCGDTPVLKYGYPCGDNTILKYGFPNKEDTVLKYGYPCGVDAVLKYGYPCSNDANLKYGYPCSDDVNLKYGYPCGVDSVLKYGYPCTTLKYGYPNC